MSHRYRTAILLPLCGALAAGVIGIGAPVATAETRRFDTGTFDAILLRSSDDVKVVTGSARGAVATGDPAALASLSVETQGGVLRIGRTPGTHRDRGATITVTMPVLRAVTITGSGDVEAGDVAGPAFTARVAGSGDLRVSSLRVGEARIEVAGSGDAAVRGIEARRVALALRGSGDIIAAGRAQTVAADLAGSGDIDADALAATDLTVSLAGSGDIRARASGRADIAAHGSGDVVVAGGARCTVAKSGAADVACH